MVLNISRVPSIFQNSPADDEISIYDGQQWRPGANPDTQYTSVEVTVDAAGNGDFLTIAEAFIFLGASPGVVHVKAGTYTITGTITLADEQELRGSGYGTLIQTTMNAALVTASGDNTGVYNLRLDGSDAGISQTGISISGDFCTVRNVWITDMGRDGILAVGTESSIVDGCRISDCDRNGIYFVPNTLGSITNCDIQTCDNQGIELNGALYNIISANNVHNCGSTSAGEGGIEISGNSFQNIIQGNSIRDNAGANETGLTIGASAIENVITGNILINNTTNFTDNGTNTQIGHNIFT